MRAATTSILAANKPGFAKFQKSGDAKFAQRDLLAAPATAFMSSVSDAAIRLCLDHNRSIDTLEVLTMFKGNPTFGSTQTIFAVIQTDAFYLEQNAYKPWPRATRYDVIVPGEHSNSTCPGLGRLSASRLV